MWQVNSHNDYNLKHKYNRTKNEFLQIQGRLSSIHNKLDLANHNQILHISRQHNCFHMFLILLWSDWYGRKYKQIYFNKTWNNSVEMLFVEWATGGRQPYLQCISNKHIMLNSFWPTDMIWRHRSRSTLAQIMAWNQCWLLISGIHLTLISQKVLKVLFCVMCLKIILWKWLPYLLLTNELRTWNHHDNIKVVMTMT